MWETNVCCLSHPVSGGPLYQPELPGGLVWSAGGCLLWPITSTGLWGIVGPPIAEVHGPGHSPLISKSTHTSPSQCLCIPCWGPGNSQKPCMSPAASGSFFWPLIPARAAQLSLHNRMQPCAVPPPTASPAHRVRHKHPFSPPPTAHILRILRPTWVFPPYPLLGILSDLGKPGTWSFWPRAPTTIHLPGRTITREQGALASPSSPLHESLILSSIMGWPSPCPSRRPG